MGNTYFLEKYAQMRHKDFVEVARMERLIREIERQKPGLWQKLTWRVGDWLIGLGHMLKHEQTLPSKLDFQAEGLKVLKWTSKQ